MILTHAGARDYCVTVLDFIGAGGVVRNSVRQKIRSELAGELQFNSWLETDSDCPGEQQGCAVPYSLPVEPDRLRKLIIMTAAPSSARYLR